MLCCIYSLMFRCLGVATIREVDELRTKLDEIQSSLAYNRTIIENMHRNMMEARKRVEAIEHRVESVAKEKDADKPQWRFFSEEKEEDAGSG